VLKKKKTPPKTKPESVKSKSVEVKVKVPLSSTGFMSLVLAVLIGSMGYSGYLGIKSIWNFTHPQFNISADAFRILPVLFETGMLPTNPIPAGTIENPIDEVKKKAFLDETRLFLSDFRKKFPDSKLGIVSDNDLVNMATSFCSAKSEALAKGETPDLTAIISAHQAKFVMQYPTIDGLSEFLTGVGESAFKNMCGD
jgi:hypothetical protein